MDATGFKNGVVISNVDEVLIEDVEVANANEHGILLLNCGTAVVRRTESHHNGQNGGSQGSGLFASNWQNLLIEGSEFSDNSEHYGLYLLGGDAPNTAVREVVADRNVAGVSVRAIDADVDRVTARNNTSYGVATSNRIQDPPTRSLRPHIHDCVLEGNETAQVSLGNVNDPLVEGNSLVCSDAGQAGVRVYQSDGAVISGNTITGPEGFTVVNEDTGAENVTFEDSNTVIET